MPRKASVKIISESSTGLNTRVSINGMGVSPTQLINLVRLGFLHPIKLGMGNKFSQADILEFQEKYKGQDLSNGAKLLKIKELERKKGTAPTVPDKNQPSSL